MCESGYLRACKNNQELIIMPFMAGDKEYGYPGLLVAPKNAGFFAAAPADLQGFIPKEEMPDTCELNPITDDMAICHPYFQKENHKLVVKDAESAWFLRVNHITKYGTSPYHEKICIHPKEPLIFLNMQAQPNSRVNN